MKTSKIAAALWLLSAALTLSAAAPDIPIWDLGNEAPHLYLDRNDVLKQKASYAVMPDGKKALKIDLSKTLRHTWSGAFRENRPLPDFSRGTLKVRYYVPPQCGVVRLTLLLSDFNNERFPFDFRPEQTPGWHEKSFALDTEKPRKPAWRTYLTAPHDGKRIDVVSKPGICENPVRVIGINGAVASPVNRARNNWIGIGAITLEVTSSNTAIRPRLETGTRFHVLKKGDEKKLALAFFNPEPVAYQGSVTFTVTDAYGKMVEQKSAPVKAAPGATVRIPLTVPRKYGAYQVRSVVRGNGKKELALTQSFAYLDPTGATPGVKPSGFLFGVNSHIRIWRIDSDTEADAMALCGVKILRSDSTWDIAQPDPKLPLSHATIDETLEPYEKLGIEWQPVMIFPPKWALDPNVKPIWPGQKDFIKYCPKTDAWRAYCRSTFQHYKGRVRYFEVWNEADISFANFGWSDYIKLLRIANEELKKVNPSARLMPAGYAWIPGYGKTDPNHMQKTLKDHGSYDVLAFHGHCLYPQYRRDFTTVVNTVRKLAPGKPYYANETAISSVSTGELEQGNQLFKKLLFTWSKGAIGYTWYDFRNDGYDPLFNEHNFGMMTHDFYPKPVYAVYNTLTKHLADAKFLQTMSDEPAIEGYFFRAKNGDLYYAFWGWKRCDISYALKNVTGRASLIDLFGNETPLAVRNGCVVLPVRNEGQFLRLQGQKEIPALAGEIFATAHLPLTAEAEKTTTTAVTLFNPLPVPATLGWELLSPAPLTVAPAKLTAKLAPGEKKTVSVKITAPKNASVEQLSGILKMTQKIDGVTLPVALLPVVAVSNSIPEGKNPLKPQFVIDRAFNVHQLDFSPAGLWSGPKDSSAEVRLSWKAEVIYVGVDVTDNRFCQPYTGFDGFNGDNVQFFFAIPGQEGFWEFGISKTPKGVDKWCYHAPKGKKKFTDFAVRITPLPGGKLRYQAWLHLAKLGLTERIGTKGFRFNCFVNDNDGFGRKSYIGIYTEKEPDHWPLVFFR